MLEKPIHWNQMSHEEKRAMRLEAWAAGKTVSFESPEARVQYQQRANLIKDAVELKKAPARVPVAGLGGAYMYRRKGVNQKATMYDRWEEAANAVIEFQKDFQTDTGAFMFLMSGPSMELLGQTNMKWAGYGLPDDSQYQFVEQEYLKADEYDHFINDPTDYLLRVFWPRFHPALAGLKKIAPLTIDNIGFGVAQLAFMDPDVQRALDLLKQSAMLSLPPLQVTMQTAGRLQAMGYPSFSSGFGAAPYDSLGDMLRGTKGIMTDLFRRPEKIRSACDKIATLYKVPDLPLGSPPFIFMPLHKGAEGFMSEDQYAEFYWPTFKKVMLDMIEEGLIPLPFAEGRFNSRMEFITELPKASSVWFFDQSDMHLAKDILGDTCCIMGNVPISLIATGSPEQVEDCCRDLIDYCGRGGGFILAPSTQIDEGREETVRALADFPKKYIGNS